MDRHADYELREAELKIVDQAISASLGIIDWRIQKVASLKEKDHGKLLAHVAEAHGEVDKYLKNGSDAFKQIHDGTCVAPKIILLP